MKISLLSTCSTLLVCLSLRAAEQPPHWKMAPTPPMGWNSYDAFGSSVTEEEFLANATYVRDKLKESGYQYVVIDYRWSDATAAKHDTNGNGGPLTADTFGRLIPAPNRFPSAADGKGFKPLSDKVHVMGLKFGIHVMRGIPKQSVSTNTPIEGSRFKAGDAADIKSPCSWCQDMWGVDATKQAGRDYYDSIFRLYASWGVDFVKVDDLSCPYHKEEIEAIRQAIDKSGRPMVFSTSPGATPVNVGDHVSRHANMWRVSGDFWDNWKSLDHAFDLAAAWEAVGGPGRWPDYDMLPLGRIGIRCVGGNRITHFTHDEQMTMMTLWALGPSPLMLGGNLPDNDDWTLSLISNPGVLAINQDPLGNPARRVTRQNQTEVWTRKLQGGKIAAGLFNRGKTATDVTLSWSEAGLTGSLKARDIWDNHDLGKIDHDIKASVHPHGCILILLSP